MTKKEFQQFILKDGKPLPSNKFKLNADTHTFMCYEDNLFMDITGLENWTFYIGSNCTIQGGHNCTFFAQNNCTFDTGASCIFKTLNDCTFKTGYSCVFVTGSNCTFKTDKYCTFKTRNECIFETDGDCTFDCFLNAFVNNISNGNILIVRDYINTIKVYNLDKLKKDRTHFLSVYCH